MVNDAETEEATDAKSARPSLPSFQRIRFTDMELAALIRGIHMDPDDADLLRARAKIAEAFVKTGGVVKNGLPSSHGGPDVPEVAR